MAREELDQALCQVGGEITNPCLAECLDSQYTNDPCKCARESFFIPKFCHLPYLSDQEDRKDEECIYLCGHSLGLQPRATVQLAIDIMTKWGTMGVESHFISDRPFNQCDLEPAGMMAKVVGGHADEVALMNSLTVNLHLMMSCFYQPNQCRFKIIHEDDIFSSDKYALDSHVRRYGFDPETALVSGGNCTESIINALQEHGESVAIVFIGTVQYFTGYRFNIKEITDAAHSQGAFAAFDVAHAVGVTPLQLHDDDVDFAVWCTYKYMCGGPSSAGGVFIHRKHHRGDFPCRLDGWWASRAESRMSMCPEIDRDCGANGFRVSHPNPFQCDLLLPMLDMLTCKIGMDQVVSRGQLLSEYLLQMLEAQFPGIEILTPRDATMRGCHLAVKMPGEKSSCEIYNQLKISGVMVDIRKEYLRISVHPLYTTFTEIYRFVCCLATICA